MFGWMFGEGKDKEYSDNHKVYIIHETDNYVMTEISEKLYTENSDVRSEDTLNWLEFMDDKGLTYCGQIGLAEMMVFIFYKREDVTFCSEYIKS